jgi:hypothetical protein
LFTFLFSTLFYSRVRHSDSTLADLFFMTSFPPVKELFTGLPPDFTLPVPQVLPVSRSGQLTRQPFYLSTIPLDDYFNNYLSIC